MKESYTRLLDLRSQVDKLEVFLPVVIHEYERSSDFAHIFAAEMNKIALQKRRDELHSLLASNHKEVFEIVLTGEGIGIGTASATSIGSFLEGLQDLFTRVTQSIVHGARDCGPVPFTIKEASNLQIEAVAPGSFKILFSGNIPDSGMFEGDNEVLSDNAFSKTTQLFFDVLEETDQDVILENIIPLGNCVASSFKAFANIMANNKMNIASTWNSVSGSRRYWQKDYSFMNNLVLALDQVEAPESVPESYTGSFVEVHSEKNKVEFRITDSETIKGIFSDDLKSKLREMNVNPLNPQKYQASFIKETYKYTKSNREKTVWILTDVREE